jgi:hypothetical protein
MAKRGELFGWALEACDGEIGRLKDSSIARVNPTESIALCDENPRRDESMPSHAFTRH